MALTVPFAAVFTGRCGSHAVSRNPLHWVGLFLYGLLLIPFILIVYPVAILMTWLGMASLALTGLDARQTSEGLEIHSKRGVVKTLKWSDIDRAERRFKPPVFYVAILESGGEWIELVLADTDAIIESCRQNGILVNKELRFE